MGNKRRIEYIPPSRQEIFDYAKLVCKAMNISDNQTPWGLTNFLEVIARVVARIMTNEANQEIEGKNE